MKKILFVLVSSFLVHAALPAQQQPQHDPIGDAFFPPETVMQNQQAINLTEGQRNTIMKEIQTAQSEFMTLQWDLQKEVEKFKGLIEKVKPIEQEVISQLEKMLSVENKIKKRQITLLVRIKNALNGEQQEILQRLKKN